MKICQTIRDNEEIFKRSSIYLLDNDIDRNFEFFVFVDAGNEENRPLFLKALRVALGFDKEEDQNVKNECKKEWETWFDNKEQPAPEFDILKWLKIAIEKYPYRLFVVISPDEWAQNGHNPITSNFWYDGKLPEEGWKLQKDDNEAFLTPAKDTRRWKKSKFLYKRICWISINEFKRGVPWGDNTTKRNYSAFPVLKDLFQNMDQNKARAEYFKLWLYLKWVKHVAIRIRELKEQKKLCLWFYQLHDISSQERRNPPYFPASLPKPFRTYEKSKFIQGCILDWTKMLIQTLKNNEEFKNYFNTSETMNFSFCVFRRHGHVLEYQEKNNKGWELTMDFDSNACIYGEFLTGILSYLIQFLDATSASGNSNIRSINFLLAITEQALMRIFVVDERVQENYLKFSKRDAGYILGQRVFISYLDEPDTYDQKKRPDNGIYASILSQDQPALRIYQNRNQNFEVIFQKDRLSSDCLIIHQGIFDKYGNETKADIQDKVLKWKEHIPFIIVTSGRGIPSNIARGVKFLPFSNLKSCLQGVRFEKLTLVKQLLSLKEI